MTSFLPTQADPIALGVRAKRQPTDADLELACEIEKDGRRRESLGAHISLSDYLRWIPDPAHYPLALDAAIDMVLRSAQIRGTGLDEAKSNLVVTYPDFEPQIARASTLSNLLVSTESFSSIAYPQPMTPPTDFGPPLSDGKPRYLIEELLGGGSSGWVYRAVDRQMSSRFNTAFVALKVYHQSICGMLPASASFEEAARVRLIDHPNAVRAYDREILPTGESYAVFSLAPGMPMHEWIDNENPSIRERVRVIRDIASALSEVHRVGIIHGDIKPANILVNSEGRAWLTDFGHAFDAACPATDRVGKVGGNLAFASPEQVNDSKNFGFASDVFSISSLLIWAVTNELPMGSHATGVLETIQRRKSRPALEAVGHVADSDLREIARRGAAWDPASRCKTADEFASDLTCWLEHRPIGWLRPSLLKRLALVDKRQPVSVKLALVGISAVALLASFNFSLRDTVSNSKHTQQVLDQQVHNQRALFLQLKDQVEANFGIAPKEESSDP